MPFILNCPFWRVQNFQNTGGLMLSEYPNRSVRLHRFCACQCMAPDLGRLGRPVPRRVGSSAPRPRRKY